VDLAAYGAGHRLIDMVVLGDVFGGEALNALSGCEAAVDEERHGPDPLGECNVRRRFGVQLMQVKNSVRTSALWLGAALVLPGGNTELQGRPGPNHLPGLAPAVLPISVPQLPAIYGFAGAGLARRLRRQA
jgi:hypothetical protein